LKRVLVIYVLILTNVNICLGPRLLQLCQDSPMVNVLKMVLKRETPKEVSESVVTSARYTHTWSCLR